MIGVMSQKEEHIYHLLKGLVFLQISCLKETFFVLIFFTITEI